MAWKQNRTDVRVTKIRGDRMYVTEDLIVREVPVTLFLNGKEFVTLLCSPDSLEELAVGFLCSEGILQQPPDLKSININSEEGLVYIEATVSQTEKTLINRYNTACYGRDRSIFYFINNIKNVSTVKTDFIKITPGQVLTLTDRLEQMSLLFRETGGVHNAALCNNVEVILFYEDIGRHNAVDKIFGKSFLSGITLEDKLLIFSGRISSEILLKAAQMGIPIIISRSAPTALAIDIADKLGITVVGFAHGDKLNIYTHPKRVTAM